MTSPIFTSGFCSRNEAIPAKVIKDQGHTWVDVDTQMGVNQGLIGRAIKAL